MSVKWVKDFKPEIMIKEVEKIKRIQPDGNISFEGFAFIQYETILHSMLQYPDDVPETETKRITWESIRNAGKSGEITEKAIRSEANKLVNAYLQSAITKYVLVTSVSIQNTFSKMPAKEVNIKNIKIVFKKSPPTKYIKEATETLKKAKASIIGDYPQDYLSVLAYVSARSFHEAADKALEAIDLIRGIWNLYINQQTSWKISWSVTRKPINKIILGPVHTLHYPKGKMASTDIWWYEPQYVGPVTAHKFDNAAKLNQLFRKTKTKLDRHPYGNFLNNAIIRYTRALDEMDWDNAFLRLWNVLELLTDTGKNSYDVTIKRASFIFEDREFNTQILEILRKHRNSYVHSDHKSQDIETYLYQLKFYVENMIRFHLWNKFGFTSINEAIQFLDSPKDEKMLNERIQTYKRVKKFLHFK